MSKENVFQHNFRLNMDNPIHYKLHQQLMNIDEDIYRSKNEFMIKKLCIGIFGKSDLDLIEEEENKNHKVDKEEKRYRKQRAKEALERMEKRITENVMKEVMKALMNMIVWNNPVQNLSNNDTKTEYDEDFIDDDIANAALGYFD